MNTRPLAAAICLLVAFMYMRLWPGRRDAQLVARRTPWARIVLRWFHSLTWVILGLACLLWSRALALAAVIVY
ncbi:MAG TPA: hypothetical protein VH744_03435, partial [Terriglobales bacterium]